MTDKSTPPFLHMTDPQSTLTLSRLEAACVDNAFVYAAPSSSDQEAVAWQLCKVSAVAARCVIAPKIWAILVITLAIVTNANDCLERHLR
ncbi:hypothetical protein OVY29_20640 [Sphingopyxis sp. SE2]|uniref:hypothetical protein n=1 Tax=Sphingopyxis sp. SE2 TaxID=1586240 RepID=UPI0028C02469|nr:hypothetical protein [Sphingopyxis sp. SE2]MDT7531076.1 hypothetical protein [Sphingopyxis sp. SE2]